MADPAEPSEPGPREPEIELLGKLARAGLFVIRVVFLVAGVTAVLYGLKRTFVEGDGWAWGDFAWRATPSASGAVWLTLGLPLAAPASAMLDRGWARRALLLTSAALWVGPAALGDDSDYGYILRLFATLVAFLCLFVWRTLWRLTDTGLPRAADGPTL